MKILLLLLLFIVLVIFIGYLIIRFLNFYYSQRRIKEIIKDYDSYYNDKDFLVEVLEYSLDEKTFLAVLYKLSLRKIDAIEKDNK